jgi:hypothetical protein
MSEGLWRILLPIRIQGGSEGHACHEGCDESVGVECDGDGECANCCGPHTGW